MSLFRASEGLRRAAATAALGALGALALGFCVCEMPMPAVASECHESGPAASPAKPSVDGAWSSNCCCSGDPTLPPGTLEARAPDAPRAPVLFASDSAFATRLPALDEPGLMAAPPWLVAASPPHAPPTAFVLPLRV